MSAGGDENGRKGSAEGGERLAAVLEAYGAEPRRWPKDERRALEGVCQSGVLGGLVEETFSFDDLLNRLPPAVPSHALGARVLSAFDMVAKRNGAGLLAAVRQAIDVVWPDAPLWQPASALVLSLIVGLAAGILAPSEVFSRDNGEQLASTLFDSSTSFDLGQGS